MPVPNAIANSEDEITKMIQNNQYPMAVKTGNTDSNGNTAYRGVLYNFTSSSENVEIIAMSYSATSGYIEPAYLERDDDYGDASPNGIKYLQNIIGFIQSGNELKTAWTNQMQNEFDDMVKKVSSAGGYYISRYEMSGTIDEETGDISTESKPNATAFTGGTSYKSDYLRWYGLYKAGKSYTHSGITSTMIWGSQYDQMMIWMAKTGTDVTQSNSSKMNTSSTITGVIDSQDIINKVYDLYGGRREWTLEAYNNVGRVVRGGTYDIKLSKIHREYCMPTEEDSYHSSRLTLYVKWFEILN